MKTTRNLWATVALIFMISPAFAQDTTNTLTAPNKNSEARASNQIEMDSAQWTTTVKETELLNGMTKVMINKVCLDSMVSPIENQNDEPKPIGDVVESTPLR